MRNGTKHKMMPLLSPFMTCVLSCLFCQMKWQMCRSRDCSGLFLYAIKPQRGLTGQLIPIPYPIYIEKKKNRIWNKNYQACCNPMNYEESSHLSFDFSRLLRHAVEKSRGPILYSKKKNQDLTGNIPNIKVLPLLVSEKKNFKVFLLY